MTGPGRTMADLAAVLGGQMIGSGVDTTEVVGVTHDSRGVGRGWLFAALRGASHDGHDFVGEAESRGAAGLLVDRRLAANLPQIVVSDTRDSLGPASDLIFGHPSRHTKVVGVTGTNGKTTVTHYIESLGRGVGRRTGLVGTIGARLDGREVEIGHTTPEAPDFQRLLHQMVESGVEIVATEVSSHALDLHRVDATRFAVAAFTNLSQDHLDYHGTMESYLNAKTRLFTGFEVGVGVVNVDDEAGRKIASAFDGDLVRIGRGGDLYVADVSPVKGGTVVAIESSWGSHHGVVPLVGWFNVLNAAVAIACLLALDESFDEVVGRLSDLPGVPGRFENVADDEDFSVIIDYAHTPQSVESAMIAARSIARGRLIALVGAGGDRDKEKRPQMGGALRLADLSIVTSDNPRSEDPSAIISDVLEGIDENIESVVVKDRREAIATAVGLAGKGDVVLVLGRGHERHQEVAGELVPFDDRQVAREAVAMRRAKLG